MSRAAWEPAARQAAAQYGLPPGGFAELVQVESAYDPLAFNPSGATGLTQLMPAAALQMGAIVAPPATVESYIERYRDSPGEANAWLLSQPNVIDSRRDPIRNLDAGARYLAWLAYDVIPSHLAPGEDVFPAALAAYNWGPGWVVGNLDDHGGYLAIDDLPPETQAYVTRLAPTFGTAIGRPSGGSGWGTMLLLTLLGWFLFKGTRKMLA